MNRLLSLFLVVGVQFHSHAEDIDQYQWLEEIEGKQAIEWVKKQNEASYKSIEQREEFAALRSVAEKILNAKDKLAEGQLLGGYVYNLWQDDTHIRGLWRRASVESYNKGQPVWELLLDIDNLGKIENENWVFKGYSCLAPGYTRCLMSLSRGGKDAFVLREFDVVNRRFVPDGDLPFYLREMKSSVSWINADTLILAAPLTDAGKTDSGYAREIRVWHRGEKPENAAVIFTGEKSDIAVHGYKLEHSGKSVLFVGREINSLAQEHYILNPDLKTTTRLPLPHELAVQGLYQGLLIVSSDRDWSLPSINGKPIKASAGSLVGFDLDTFVKTGKVSRIEVLFEATASTSFQQVLITKSHVYLTYLDNVRSQLVRRTRVGQSWVNKIIQIQNGGTVTIANTTVEQDDIYVTNTDFLTPTQILYVDASEKPNVQMVAQLPMRFDAQNLVTEQRFAKSKDGTKIPFFVVRPKNQAINGTDSTLLYGYGGFGISLTPVYRAIVGKLWLEQGGTYVLANIRGGNEFGPRWHLSAVRENRVKAYEDFIAVAEELIRLKITSPPKLAMQGGSNGGLLVAAVMVMRPELFGAVVSEVPLTDMLRFQKLLAGASWTGEYGNPDTDATIHAFWEKFSPYQNVNENTKYPPILFTTSTKDDRVHPGHARKMAAKMLDMQHDVTYYENVEGGHSGGANLLQVAHRNALVYTFLGSRLGLF